MSTTAERLTLTIQAVCPVVSVSIGADGISATFIPDPSATAPQIAAGQSAIAGFDFSAAAGLVFDNIQARALAIGALADPAQSNKLVRALMLVILDEVNLIRSLLVPAQGARTANQLRTAIQGKLNSGAADN